MHLSEETVRRVSEADPTRDMTKNHTYFFYNSLLCISVCNRSTWKFINRYC